MKPANLLPISEPQVVEHTIDLSMSFARAKKARNIYNNMQDKMLPVLCTSAWPDMWPAPKGDLMAAGLGHLFSNSVNGQYKNMSGKMDCEDGACGPVELVHQPWFYRATLVSPDEVIIPRSEATNPPNWRHALTAPDSSPWASGVRRVWSARRVPLDQSQADASPHAGRLQAG